MELPSVVFVVLLVLKLIGVVDWSWWWVTAPLWIAAIVSGLVIVVFRSVAVWSVRD